MPKVLLVTTPGSSSCFPFCRDHHHSGRPYVPTGAERHDDDHHSGCLVANVLLKVFEWYKDTYLHSCIWHLLDYPVSQSRAQLVKLLTRDSCVSDLNYFLLNIFQYKVQGN